MTPLALFLLPEALPLVLCGPLLWLVLARRARGRGRDPVEASSTRPAPGPALSCAGLSLLALAAAQPAWGTAVRDVGTRSLDLVLCLDVSRSMLARDLVPDRLGRAKDEVLALLRRARGDRLALVLFAGEARLAVPLTSDGEGFATLLGQAEPASVPVGGTDLGAALERAHAAFAAEAEAPRAVVLLTDGEDHEGRGLAAATKLGEDGIAVYAVGLGSALGSRVTVEVGGEERYLEARDGSEVVSRMDAAGLRRMAEASGGSFVDGSRSLHPLLELADGPLLALRAEADRHGDAEQRVNRYAWPLLLGFVLLVLELALRPRRDA
ncbi:MAG: VWA domain-containing protein [Planctomycetota bacterium]